MKKKICLLSLLFITLISFGFAQKCKYEYNKVDEFTGSISKGIKIRVSMWFYLGLNKNGDVYTLGASIILNGEFNQSIEQGDSLLLKLANGDVLTLYAIERSAPVSQVVQGTNNVPVVRSRYDVRYAISEEQLQMTKNTEVTHVRMYVASRYHDENVSAKLAEKIRNSINCILQ